MRNDIVTKEQTALFVLNTCNMHDFNVTLLKKEEAQ